VSWELRIGNALELLREMPEQSVHCCITSPPYYGLRDYGTGEWEGGDEACDHLRRDLADNDNLSRSPASTRGGGASRGGADHLQFGAVCEKCGATRIDEQIGLEDSPDEFVGKLVEVFREVHRVLRDDGTLWLNLGDSYARSAGPRNGHFGRTAAGAMIPDGRDTRRTPAGTKSKDLLGIPWMVAFALRADGWYLRSEIIWNKPNPMPSSATDRPTVAHETIFLLAKSERYYYDAVAIREPDKESDHARTVLGGQPSLEPTNGLHPPHGGLRTAAGRDGAGANKRDVWTVATRPYPEAHFATYPPQLIEPMVFAGVPRQVCDECGAPWERQLERKFYGNLRTADNRDGRHDAERGLSRNNFGGASRQAEYVPPKTIGWEATCSCEDEGTAVGVVLDPFVGSGTTLEVAVRNGRSAIGLDLNPKNEALVRKRMAGVTPSMFDAV
jgi:DNA modification methylase